MRAQRVLLLLHPEFRPDKAGRKSATEFDVWKALRAQRHVIEIAALRHDLRRFDRQLMEFRPDIVFNLLEEFGGEAIFDFHPISYLESLGIPYTGCNPRALVLTRNKFWTGGVARAGGAQVPSTQLVTRGFGRAVQYPAFVKFNREHASLGITRSNVVQNVKQLRTALARMRALHSGELLVQDFIAGDEVSVSVWGNAKAQALSPWHLRLPSVQDVATARVKFSSRHRQRRKIRAGRLRAGEDSPLRPLSERLYRDLDMNGYARFDFRIDHLGQAFLIDVNANPNLARDEDFAASARRHGYEYAAVIERILQLGFDYEPRL